MWNPITVTTAAVCDPGELDKYSCSCKWYMVAEQLTLAEELVVLNTHSSYRARDALDEDPDTTDALSNVPSMKDAERLAS